MGIRGASQSLNTGCSGRLRRRAPLLAAGFIGCTADRPRLIVVPTEVDAD